MYRRYEPSEHQKLNEAQKINRRPPINPKINADYKLKNKKDNLFGNSKDNLKESNNKKYKKKDNGQREEQQYKKKHKSHKTKKHINPLINFIPASIYNPEDKKILGFLSAEDLLLIALIFLFLESDDSESNTMVYALVFVLVSEWFDLSFLENI